MFSINENNSLFLYATPVDLRKGFNTLSGIVTNSGTGFRPSDGKVYLVAPYYRLNISISIK